MTPLIVYKAGHISADKTGVC